MSEGVNSCKALITSDKPRHYRRWLRPTLMIVCLSLLVALVLMVITIIWLGPIVESYIERNDNDIVSRRIEIDNLRLRLFDGTATADNIILYEADETTRFASIDHMEVDIDVSEIFNGHIYITRAHLTRPHIRIVKENEAFNFDDMVEFIVIKYIIPNKLDDEFDSEKDDDDEWRVTIENVTIEDGYIEYLDSDIEQRWELSAINLHADEIYSDSSMSTMNTHMRVNNQAEVKGELSVNFKSFDFDFCGAIENFDIGDTYKHWCSQQNIAAIGGSVDADIHIMGNMADFAATDISGDIQAREVQICGVNDNYALCADTINIDIEHINFKEGTYRLNTIYAEGYDMRLILNEEQADSIMASNRDYTEDKTDDVHTDDDTAFTIGELSLTDGSLHYEDSRLSRGHGYDINNISISAKEFDLNGTNDIAVCIDTPKLGMLSKKIEGILHIERDEEGEYALSLIVNDICIPLM